MLSFKTLKIMALSCGLLAMPLLASADYGERDYLVRASRDLELGDFSGDFALYGSSVGGVAGTLTSGSSSSFIGQLFFDKCGNATVNFWSESIYTGPIGTPLASRSLPPGVTVDLTITDARRGLGNIVITDSSIIPTTRYHCRLCCYKIKI